MSLGYETLGPSVTVRAHVRVCQPVSLVSMSYASFTAWNFAVASALRPPSEQRMIDGLGLNADGATVRKAVNVVADGSISGKYARIGMVVWPIRVPLQRGLAVGFANAL